MLSKEPESLSKWFIKASLNYKRFTLSYTPCRSWIRTSSISKLAFFFTPHNWGWCHTYVQQSDQSGKFYCDEKSSQWSKTFPVRENWQLNFIFSHLDDFLFFPPQWCATNEQVNVKRLIAETEPQRLELLYYQFASRSNPSGKNPSKCIIACHLKGQ